MASSRSKPPAAPAAQQKPTVQMPRAKPGAPAPKHTMEVDATWLEKDARAERSSGKPPPIPKPAPAHFQAKPTVREMPARRLAQNLPTKAEMRAVDPRAELDSAPPPPTSKASGVRPPALDRQAARHHTMQVEATWLEEPGETDRKLRASLAPLPPIEEKSKAKVTGLSREEPDDEPAARPSKRPSRAPTAREKSTMAPPKKSATNATNAKRAVPATTKTQTSR